MQKPTIRKFKRRKAYSSFKDDIWDADLAEMRLISKYNKDEKILLCVIDVFSKYAWVVPLKDKKGAIVVMHFGVFQVIQKENQAKYGLIKEANFIMT